MRSLLIAALLASAGCTCGAQKLPAAPASLNAALEAADKTVGIGPVPEAKAACEAVSRELAAWGKVAQREEQTALLVTELGEFSENGLRLAATRSDWADLRLRIDRLIQTGKALQGPRFRRDLPREVREAIATAEQAFSTGDQRGGCDATDQATMALSDFAWSEPAPRALEKVKDALSQLDAMPEGCRTSPLPEVKQRFADAVRPLER